MKSKSIYLLCALVLLGATLLAGCGSSKSDLVEGKVNVITTFYPLYDFTKKIGGDHVNVINLIPTGVDPHDWSPKPQDIKDITNADLLIYNGLGFEGWVDNFLENLDSKSELVSVEASLGIETMADAHEEEVHEEDEHAHEEGHEEEGHEEDEHAHEEEGHAENEVAHEDENHEEENHEDGHDHGEFDPHVWLSPLQAKKIAENIKDALIATDAANQSEYETNYNDLIAQLDDLHSKYVEVTSAASKKDIVVSHQAYGYLARDYGLNQIAIMGLSTEAEPTPQDMKYISDFVKEHDVKYILFEELVSPKQAQSLANDLSIETLVFNPIEGLTDEQLEAGEDYISMMERNLTSLEKALQ